MILSKDENGKYERYAWPGGYPLYYVSTYVVFCPDCADKDTEWEDDPITEAQVNWEDDSLFCDICGQRIESAYNG